MKRRLLFTLAIGTMVLLQAPAVKGQDHSFWHSCGVDRERNNLWPQPFRAADSAAVYSPFDVMKTNGGNSITRWEVASSTNSRDLRIQESFGWSGS